MSTVFPEPVTNLPAAAIRVAGVTGYLSQSKGHQILFMEFSEDVELPEHSHESQWGVVLEGTIDLVIDGIEHTFSKGDRYFIQRGVRHSARVRAGYADITFFDQEDRYRVATDHLKE